MIQLSERAPGFLNDGDIGSAFRKLCSLTRSSYVENNEKYFSFMIFLINSDPTKFFDHAKKYIEYLKKQIEFQSNNYKRTK